MTRRWLVAGGQGMLGQALAAELDRRGIPATVTDRDQLDITDRAAVADAIPGHDVVINAAAWTAVDAAEASEQAAHVINATAPGTLAEACETAGAELIHMSTDHVFPGTAGSPYRETAATGPVNAYGRTKLAGEQAVLAAAPTRGHVVRTAWLYGAGGRNFVSTILRAAEQRDRVDVVADQWGQPTWTVPLAERLVDLAAAAAAGRVGPGVLHAASSGATTWYRFARAVFREADLDPARIQPITTDQYPLPARRPAYAVLSLRRWCAAGMQPLGHWRPMLAAAINDSGLCASSTGGLSDLAG